MLATRVVSRIRAAFLVDVHLRSFFQGPTIADMALVIVQNQAQQAEAEDIDRLLTELELLKNADKYLLRWGKSKQEVKVERWMNPLLRWTNPFRTINGYGLFRVMTTERPEIVIEGSTDGINWTQYKFNWKPGDLKRAAVQI